jgi:hypothetical protein
MLNYQTGYPTQVPIDGTLIRITVNRLTVGEASAFRRAYDRFLQKDSVRRVSIRRDGEEMQKQAVPRARTEAEAAAAVALARFDELSPRPAIAPELQDVLAACRGLVPADPIDEAFVIPLDEIRRRRIAEMSVEERAQFEALEQREDDDVDRFLTETVSRFVSVEPGQLVETDLASGEVSSVTTGEQLVGIFGARQDVLLGLVDMVRIENTIPEASKKALRSLFASSVSSSAPAKDPAGNGPAPTATPVGERDSAPVVDATASPGTTPAPRPATSSELEPSGVTTG